MAPEAAQNRHLGAAIAQLSSLARASRDRAWQRELLELAAACSAYSKAPRAEEQTRLVGKAKSLAALARQIGEVASAAAADAIVAALTSPPEAAPTRDAAPPPVHAQPPATAPLPQSPPPPAPIFRADAPATEPLTPHGERATWPLVFVVDSDLAMRAQLEAQLTAGRFRVVSFDDGGPVLARLRNERPALIVCDLVLPMMPGEVLILALRRTPATATIPILVVTAEPWRLGHENDVDAVVTKPIKEGAVVETARRLVSTAIGTDSLNASRV